MTTIQPMRAHGPGWVMGLGDGEDHYWVWAPQTNIVYDGNRFPGMWSADGVSWHPDDRQPRYHWAACWQNALGTDGDFVRGDTLDEVLASFPDNIANQFKEVANA